MLVHRLRRRHNNKTTLGQRLMFFDKFSGKLGLSGDLTQGFQSRPNDHALWYHSIVCM